MLEIKHPSEHHIYVADPEYYFDNTNNFVSFFGCTCHEYCMTFSKIFCHQDEEKLNHIFKNYNKYLHSSVEPKSEEISFETFTFEQAFYKSNFQLFIQPEQKVIVAIHYTKIPHFDIENGDGTPHNLGDGEIKGIFRIYFQAADEKNLEEVVNQMQIYIKECSSKYKYATVKANITSYISLIYLSYDSFSLRKKKIRKVLASDLEYCYNPSFYEIDKSIKTKLIGEKSGLLILHGVPGSGKTNYIRHLIHHINEATNEQCNIILITGDQISLILRPDFIDYLSELCSEKLTYLILEDCEQLIKKREKDDFFNKVSEILNLSDGLYSDIFKTDSANTILIKSLN